MCGIVGFINNNKNKRPILNKMLKAIEHRGPDGTGLFIDHNIALGHNRLAIIDIEGGEQPIYNEDKSLVIIFNGEIYNYQELREELICAGHTFKTNSDTEVIIHAYEEWKIDTPSHLRGMFAFAIWDILHEELVLARDEAGIKPLYYSKFLNTFIFASEIKAILKYKNFKKELNKDILSSYLCCGFVPTNETFFKGIWSVEPGEIMIVKNNKLFRKKYFHLEMEEGNVSEKEIKSTLENSIRYHEISDVPVGSFLSSGIDSSFIVSLANVKKLIQLVMKIMSIVK